MGTGESNYAFIDWTNVYRGVRELGWKIDYRRFRRYLKDKYNIERAYIFIGYVPQLSLMYRDFQNAGYTIVFKPTVPDGRGGVKGNCDAELVLQAMIDFGHYEKAVIVTGDGDFLCLVEHLSKEEKLKKLIAPNRRKCSSLLKKSFPNQILFLDDFRERMEHVARNEKAPARDETREGAFS